MSDQQIEDQRRHEATLAVIHWIQETWGNEMADWWAWECTPMPCGLPDDEQLEDGLRLATKEISPGQLQDKMDDWMRELSRQTEELQAKERQENQ